MYTDINGLSDIVELLLVLNVDSKETYRNDPKFLDRLIWANSADPEKQSDQGLYCLLFHLHLFDEIP